jgi:hypothetical protein
VYGAASLQGWLGCQQVLRQQPGPLGLGQCCREGSSSAAGLCQHSSLLLLLVLLLLLLLVLLAVLQLQC